ncbi:MAG: ABC transporter ATP-binding protein [Frankiales bacterium]|nr:ABC transporter ATP-binding protein [Frankiales bacterium]
MPPAALEVVDLHKRFGDVVAVDGLVLRAAAGEVTAVLGRNGAGKTTSLACATGLLRPDAGTIRILGLDPHRDRRALRPRIGVMPQSTGNGVAGVYPAARAREVLALFAALYAQPLPVDELLERLDLARVAATPWRRLSGGEQQRLSLALALVGRPELVLLDEPTAGLDLHARRSTWALIDELRASDVTIVLTTHAMDEAERLANRVVIVDRGRAVADGTLAELTAGGRALEDVYLAVTGAAT